MIKVNQHNSEKIGQNILHLVRNRVWDVAPPMAHDQALKLGYAHKRSPVIRVTKEKLFND